MKISDDEFDAAAGQVATAASTASTDPVDRAAAQVVQGERTQLRSTLYNSLLENPDMAARATQLGRRTGIPADVVSRNLPEVQRNVQLDDFDRVLQNSPTVAKWLTEQNNAALAHDDVENLGAIDTALRFTKDTGRAGLSGLQSASSGVVGLVRAPVELVAPLLDPLAGRILPENPLRRVAGGLTKIQQSIDAQAKANMPKADGIIGSGYFSGIASLSRNLAALPLLFLGPAGQRATLTGMVAPVGGQEFGEARDKGLSVIPAITYGTSQAAIEYATEKLPISRLLGDVKAGEGFLKILGRQMAVEIPGEQIATILQDLNEFAVLDPDATFSDYLRERPSAAAQTLIATIVGTGGQVTVVKGIDMAINRIVEREHLAKEAEANAQAFGQLNQLVTASKVLQRDLPTFQAFIEQASAESSVQDVFIDARVFNQAAQDAGLTMEQLPETVQTQLAEALQTGGDLRISVAEYTSQIAPTEYAQGLLDHLKTDPQGMSRAEAQVFMQSQSEELQAEVQRVLTEKADDDAFKASAEAVKASFVEQLNTAGRFTPEVNATYATLLGNFYAVTAAKAGMTPEQMMQRYPLRVQAEGVASDMVVATFDQGEVTVTDQTDETTGLPLNSDGTVTLYHHTSADKAEAIKSSGELRSAGEPDVYLTTREQTDTGYGDTAVKVRIDPKKLQIDDEFADGRVDYRVGVGQPGGALTDATFNQSATLRSGKETLKKYGLNPEGKYKTREVAAALEARQRGKYGLIEADDRSPEALAKIAKWMAEEVKFEMQNPEKSGVGWYSEKFQRAVDIMADTFPELATDKTARNTMTALIAITSDGQKVVPNFAQAMDIYGNFREGGATEGKFTTTRGHQRQASIDGNLEVIQRLYDQMGPEAMHEYLMQERSISELKKIAKENGGELKSDYQAHIKMPMAAVEFGPKLGAFYANLMGAHGYLTMDRWWSRTFNRYRGTLLQAPTRQGLDRFKALLGKPEMSDDEAISATVEYRDSYEAKNFKNGTEIEKAANTIWKAAFDALEDSPFNATDRTFMLDAVDRAQKSLKRAGYNLSVADIQAILWYYEKRLYGELGARQTADVSYEEAAQRVVAGYASGSGELALQGLAEESGENQGATQDGVSPGTEFYQSEVELDQGSGNRGQIAFGQDITQVPSIITLLKGADLSTFLHESGHFFLEVQLDLASRITGEAQMFGTETNSPGESEIVNDAQTLLKYFGVADMAEWYGMPLEQKRSYHEQFARGFEAYLFEGKAPNIELQGIFQRFRAWMLQVYKSLQNLNVEITDEVRGVMDRMLATTEQIQLAEAGRSMMPLFTSPEQAGMTTDEFAAYQALGVDATQDAIQDLQARTLRDMAWIKNAKGREVKKLQKQAEGLRAEMMMDARREIMSQPVYRAWQFLTGKATPEASSSTRTIGSAPVDTTPPVLMGIDGTLLSEGGQVFKSANAAKEAKKLQADTRVVKVDGGWALAEKTEAQLAAEAAAAKRLSLGSTGTKGLPEAAHQFIAGFGGLSKSEMADTGFDANVRVGSRWLFAAEGKGMSIERAAMLLKEAGYTQTEDHNEAYGVIQRSVTDPQYTPEGFERIAEIEAEANTADEMPGLGLDTDVTTAGKFDLTALKNLGLPAEIVQIIVDLKMTATDGIHPDIVADSFEFGSGNDLVRTLAIAETPADAIEALTDQKMLENYGELATPEAIERAADVAIHNNARARFVAAELNAVNKAAGRPKVLASAAREFAAKMIDRLQIKNIKPNQYAAAEARAAKAATQAMKAGDTAKAATEKRNQLINAYATKAAYDAQAEVQKIRKFFASVTRGGNKKLVERGRNPDVVNAARAILAAYGVAPQLETGAQEYMATLQRNDPEMYAVLRPSIEAALANAKPLDQLTMEEVRGLNDEVAAMWHLSKRSRQMEIDGNLLDIEDAGDLLNDKMQEIGIPDTMPGETSAMTPKEKALRKLQYGVALLRRVEQWAIAKDGKFGGPFTKLVFGPVKVAADKYRTERLAARKQFAELVKTIAPTLKKGEIAAPEFNYTFGKDDAGVGLAELLHAIIHTGNDSNKRKLLLGRNWATENPDGTLDTSQWDAFIERLQGEGVLTKAHYDFAQGVWDLLESTKPQAQKAHRDVYGRYFEEVTAQSFETPFGSYRGGYAPAQVDAELVTDAALRKLADQENENMAYSFPSAPSGFTKSRVDYNRPLRLDLRSLTQHLDKVLLFSYMQPAINDVNRLLSRKGVSQNLSRIDPVAYEGMLIPWLNRSARQVVETPIPGDGGFSRILSLARNRAGMSLMLANLSNTFQQITGFASALAVVDKGDLMRATAQYMANPKKMAADVAEASPFMKDRMQNEIAAVTNLMDDILLDPSLYQKGQAWTQKHAYFMQAAADNVLSPIVWTGAYNEGIKQGMDPVDAAKYGDSIVRQTQTTTLPEDVSRIETGPAYARLFTQFLNYFNTIANTNGTALMNIQRELGFRKGAGKALGVVFFGVLMPAMVAEAIAIAMRGGPDDEDNDGYLDDWLAQAAGMGTLKFLLAGVPFAGQFVVAGINRFNSNPVDDKVSLSPAISLLESAVGAPYSVYKAIMDEGSVRRAILDVSTLVAMLTGLPTRVLAKPIGYAAGVANDEIDPTGPADVVRGLVTGVPSPESRR